MTMIVQKSSIEYAMDLDAQDALGPYRDRFFIPRINGKDSVYFAGNSLGLQPKSVNDYVQQELDDWAQFGVRGHFDAKKPWFSYHELLTPKIAKIVGALDIEVVITHSLTTNLHLLMVSFYRPTERRFKIICEKKAFSSDQYVLESQVKFHGFHPNESIVEVEPREGEHLIRHEDIIETIEATGEALALVMIGGVNYYTGQLFDMKSITAATHKVGAIVGFDLAHAVGNVPLQLHDWGIDFGAWCSYKYLNSSPGGVSGMFVHERHGNNPDLPRFTGWWGSDKESRFEMKAGFVPMCGAEGWQLSNAPILGMAAHMASLDIFAEVGMVALRTKSKILTTYLEERVKDMSERKERQCKFEIITPVNQEERGAQLSILVHGKGKKLFDSLGEQGVIADWREPNVIRIAPVPLYNSFVDVFRFAQRLEKAIEQS